MNMFYMLAAPICDKLIPVWTIFGYIIFAIKIIVPLLLVVYGMLDLTKAVMKKDEKDIKGAQNLLVKKLIAAVLVYLVITIVGIVVNLVSSVDWQGCTNCAFHPFSDECYILKGEQGADSDSKK